MSETEIALASAYLKASGQDPVAALIRSVRDLARVRRMMTPAEIEPDDRHAGYRLVGVAQDANQAG